MLSKTVNSPSQVDVAIIGGGVIGCAIAYFLSARSDFHGSVLVIEKDPSYQRASTALSAGGIRQQFSTPENIYISQFGAAFFKSVPTVLACDEDVPDISFKEAGYLFLANDRNISALECNFALQRAHGVEVEMLDASALARCFSFLCTSDLRAGTVGLRDEGWIDPYSLLMALKKKARSQGVLFIDDEVIAIYRHDKHIQSVQLRHGGQIACGHVVNAAGPAAAQVAAMAGIVDLPVRPRKRMVFTFRCRTELPGCPLVIDPSGVYFRPEGDKFICGVSPPGDRDPDCTDFYVDVRIFDEVIWPVLAQRVPAFEALERGFSWAGHYAYNAIDQNAILGPHPQLRNYYFANGFSGHGLQQAPAVGRAISELITTGGYQTIDLRRFCFERFAEGKLVREINVV